MYTVTDLYIKQGKDHYKINPLTAEWVLRALIDFTLSNARRFYMFSGEPLGRERVKHEVYGKRQNEIFFLAKHGETWFI